MAGRYAASLFRLPLVTRPRLYSSSIVAPRVSTRQASTLPLINNSLAAKRSQCGCGERHCSSHAATASATTTTDTVEELLVTKEVESAVPTQEILQLEPMKYIEFTCGVCSERVCKTFSKHSYDKGTVLIRCSGCQNLHLIADNINFTGFEEKNVEEMARNRGEAINNKWEEIIKMVTKK